MIAQCRVEDVAAGDGQDKPDVQPLCQTVGNPAAVMGMEGMNQVGAEPGQTQFHLIGGNSIDRQHHRFYSGITEMPHNPVHCCHIAPQGAG